MAIGMNGIPGPAGGCASAAGRDGGRPAPRSRLKIPSQNFILLEEAFPTGWSTRV